MKVKYILPALTAILASFLAIHLYSKNENRLGRITQVNHTANEITISLEDGSNLKIGERVFVRSGDAVIIMKSTFPMMTMSKCRIEDDSKKYISLLKPGMEVYLYSKSVESDNTPASREVTPGMTAKFGTVELVYIKGGEFMMGSPETEMDRAEDELLHKVKVSDFWIGKYEVTVENYREIMGKTPDDEFAEAETEGEKPKPVNPKSPVIWIGWNEAVRFCNKMSEKYGLKPCYTFIENNGEENYYMEFVAVTCDFNANGFRLPTEAEWEYACRAGTITPYSTGETIDSTMANFERGYDDDSLLPVGSFKPNRFGLYDMHGNVAEICWDWYNGEYYKESPVDNPRGPDTADEYSFRVYRGGHMSDSSAMLRSAARPDWFPEGGSSDSIGFRLCRSVVK